MALRPDEKFSTYEAVCLFCIAFLTLIFSETMPLLVREVGPAAWMAQLGSMALAFVFLGLFWLLYRRYEEKDFLLICDAVYGKVFTKAVQLLLLIHLFLYASAMLSRCVETLQIYAYSNISALTIDLIVLGVVCVVALYSI